MDLAFQLEVQVEVVMEVLIHQQQQLLGQIIKVLVVEQEMVEQIKMVQLVEQELLF